MCNLYSMTRAQDAMRKLFGVKHDRASWKRFVTNSLGANRTYDRTEGNDLCGQLFMRFCESFKILELEIGHGISLNYAVDSATCRLREGCCCANLNGQ
jgi:hypothetical protein